MLREQIRRKLCELVFDDGEPKKKINNTVDEILALVEKELPKKDIKGGQFGIGWNDAIDAIIAALKEREDER